MMGRATFRPLRSVFTAMAIVWGGGMTAHAQAAPYLMTDTVVTDCIGELTDSGGPEEAYGNNENLVFTVDSESPLEVAFLGPIDIEAAAPGGAALFDYLVLHDGADLASPVLDTLYGSIANPPTYTTTGSLTVHFVSDASGMRPDRMGVAHRVRRQRNCVDRRHGLRSGHQLPG